MEKVIRRYRPGREGQWVSSLLTKLGRADFKPDKDMTWVVAVDNQPVAVGAWDIDPDDLTSGAGAGRIELLWVEEKFRRAGVGTLLLRRLISELRKTVRRAGADTPLRRVAMLMPTTDAAGREFLHAMKFDVTVDPPTRTMGSFTTEDTEEG
ncbi:MAG: GNAT family N-acetyltransferase [Phycisphaeraceae bacterium]